MKYQEGLIAWTPMRDLLRSGLACLGLGLTGGPGLAVCAMLLGLGAAVPAGAGIVVDGYGARSCGTWTQDRTDQVGRIVELNWLGGFITGADYATDQELLARQDVGALGAWIDNYCYSHPLSEVADAAVHLIRVLRARAGVGQ